MLFFLLLVWTLFGILGYQLGKERSAGPGGGLALGLLLGLVGIIILLCLPKADPNWQNNYDADTRIADSYNNHGNNNYPPPADAADELKKWYALKETGAITSEEFEAKKRDLLR